MEVNDLSSETGKYVYMNVIMHIHCTDLFHIVFVFYRPLDAGDINDQ